MLFLVPTMIISAAVGDEHSSRVLQGKDLSDKQHFADDGDQHDVDYDHEAFLGEEAHDFDSLSPEESIQRLGQIVDRIDKVVYHIHQ